ncbi:mechanosensitive ion channel family protein [Flaviflagellibacter deserti]|uniref:Mechanosensitive ion channel family protein n=1 Tax=Flaviflagellibacter deserti TaxID=2267266 RepID=A0ABV9YYT1_9HYPH
MSIRRVRSTLFFCLLLATTGAAVAQQPVPSPPIRFTIEVPNDEHGRALAQDQLRHTTAAQPAAPAPQSTEQSRSTRAMGEGMSSLATHLHNLRTRAMTLATAAPNVLTDIAASANSFQMMENKIDLLWLVGAVVVFIAGGFAAQAIGWWAGKGMLNYIFVAPSETVLDRLKVHGVRLSLGLLVTVSFLVGSLGAFLLFPWPPVFREIVLILLVAVFVTRLSVLIGRVVLAPAGRYGHYRMLPLTTELAKFWFFWSVWLVGIAAAGVAILSLLAIINVPYASHEVIEALWLAILGGAAILMVWGRQCREADPQSNRATALVLTFGIVLTWIFALMGLDELFWTALVAMILPVVLVVSRDAVRHIAGIDDPEKTADQTILGWSVVAERALRVVFVAIAAIVLARAWGIRLNDLAMGETGATYVLRAVLRIVIVLLAVDLAWKLVKTLIDSYIVPAPTAAHGYDDSPEARRRQRLATLLPILRNVLLVLVAVVGVLMALDAMGVQIGPLLAGAGVIGIAVGFGAQTVVKDIISGVFYLLDDAFRVGEYIVAGSHKGTVEGFSLRSVRLRHHRGPITTVPFGELGSVRNESRDWVIDKMSLGVTYDTDLEKVRKLIKKIGQELAEDEEYAHHIIEPLKMQGVDQMGEFAIQIRLKMMTKPGEQFIIRRKAYVLIKKAFEENGIKFAVPTVQVSGGGQDAAAAASATANRLADAKVAANPAAAGA